MLNLISKLTESKSKVYNSLVLSVLVFIAVCLLCVVGSMIFTDVHYSFYTD
jgi:hypothetical protein